MFLCDVNSSILLSTPMFGYRLCLVRYAEMFLIMFAMPPFCWTKTTTAKHSKVFGVVFFEFAANEMQNSKHSLSPLGWNFPFLRCLSFLPAHLIHVVYLIILIKHLMKATRGECGDGIAAPAKEPNGLRGFQFQHQS